MNDPENTQQQPGGVKTPPAASPSPAPTPPAADPKVAVKPAPTEANLGGRNHDPHPTRGFGGGDA